MRPQGSRLSPVLFDLNINDIIELESIFTHLIIQFYADDVAIMSQNIIKLKKAADHLVSRLNHLDLCINPSKSLLVSDNPADQIKLLAYPDNLLTTKSRAK